MDEYDSSDTNDSERLHPAKRRRIHFRTRSFYYDEVPDQPQPAEQFLFDDGDLVLGVEHYFFKIHRERLMCSLIFADMLELPQPEVVENLNGCPLVHLAGDSANDWRVALGWMYDRDYYVTQAAITFDMLAGAMRLSTKYEIGELREITKQELSSRWPEDLLKMNGNALAHAAEAIRLARECDVPEILPAAFYALSVQKWTFNADGGRSHLILTPADMRRLIAGREALQDFLVRILIAPLNYADHRQLEFCQQCKPLAERFWITRLTPNPSSPMGCWLLHELCEMMKASHRANLRLCWRCNFALDSLVFFRSSTLKDSIPRFFML